MDSRRLFSIELGKKTNLIKTDILDKFVEGGQMELIHRRNDGKYLKTVYKIIKGSEMYIFKSISCSPDDDEGKRNLMKEYEISLNSSRLTEGVVKPLNNKSMIAKEIGDFIMEIIYEYPGKDILSLIGRKEPENIMKYMISVALTMKELEKNNINYYNLKPENIVIKDEKVKIIDFDMSTSFESKTGLHKTTVVNDNTELYSPPEVINNKKDCPIKIDVFCWGMTLYQLITNKSIENLKDEFKLRKENHQQFLEQIKSIKIPGNRDLTWKAKEILLFVLNEEYKERPTFTELCELLQDDRKIKELEGRRILMEIVARSIVFNRSWKRGTSLSN